MSPWRFILSICLAALLSGPGLGSGHAQAPQRPFGTVTAEWAQSLDSTARELSVRQLNKARAQALLDRLAAIEAEARDIKAAAQKAIEPLAKQREALGPPPAEGQPPEAEEIAKEREKIASDIADYQARIRQADLTIARAKELGTKIAARTLERSIELLLHHYPLPFAPKTVAVAASDLVDKTATLAASPVAWWQSLGPEQRDELVLYRAPLLLLIAIGLGWGLRYLLLRWFGRTPDIEAPTYARRLSGAIAEGLADGLVPSLILAGILFGALSDVSLISGLFAKVVATFCGVMIMVTLAWALPKAVLAPNLPAWRLIAIPQDQARAIGRRIVYVAVIFAVDLFFAVTTRDLGVSDELISVYTLVMKSLETAAILAVLQERLWAWEAEPEDAEPEPAATPPTRPRHDWHFWPALRGVVGFVAVAGALTALAGYANLSRYVIENLVISGMVVGGLFLLRGLGRELIGVALRSAFVQTRLGIPHKTRSRYKFWLRAALGLAVQAIGLVLILMVWGVPADEIGRWIGGIATEIRIGDVTISPGQILVGVGVFVVGLALTRGAQRMLTERVFPHTDLDLGVRHSLSAGLGYLGLALAAVLAISAVGLDLSNIALIAGALSVGIGFGLQNIVNNFVSGLILLIERPIKVGDWIMVGGNEGTVKRINVRATEIETFQRASVIVPNSEIVAGAVTNWTLKDTYGRVEIPVGVAYGSNVERVRETLEECLRANEDILAWPEPYVLFRGFGDSSLDFEARGYISDVNRSIRIKSALCFAIERAFRDAEIEIPFPQQDLHIRSAEGLAAALGRAAPPPSPDNST